MVLLRNGLLVISHPGLQSRVANPATSYFRRFSSDGVAFTLGGSCRVTDVVCDGVLLLQEHAVACSPSVM